MRRAAACLALLWGCVDANEVRTEFCQQRPDVCNDAGQPYDAGPDETPDAGDADAGVPDAGAPDAGVSDAGTPDAGDSPDGGDGGSP